MNKVRRCNYNMVTVIDNTIVCLKFAETVELNSYKERKQKKKGRKEGRKG